MVLWIWRSSSVRVLTIDAVYEIFTEENVPVRNIVLFGPSPAGKIGMSRFKVGTKANPWRKEDGSHDFSSPTYGLRPSLVKEQLRRSIRALG